MAVNWRDGGGCWGRETLSSTKAQLRMVLYSSERVRRTRDELRYCAW